MSRAIDVARFFVHLASQEEEPTFLSHLHVQKLLYYAQGWHLAFSDCALFGERLEAWTHGPVVPDVYPFFADYRFQPIPNEQGCDNDTLSALQKQFIRSIWAGYKVYSAQKLRDMTHREDPWSRARGDLGPKEQSSNEISREAMRTFFEEKYRHNAIPGLELDKIRQAEREFAQGRGIPMDEVFADLDE